MEDGAGLLHPAGELAAKWRGGARKYVPNVLEGSLVTEDGFRRSERPLG
jgi:hypothetical protein